MLKIQSTVGEQGNAILEFAIVLPLIFMMVLGTVEFSKLFKVKEFQTMVTREAATIAFRECFERGQRDCITQDLFGQLGLNTQTRIEACLEEWGTQVTTAIGESGLLNGVSLTVSFHLQEDDEDGVPPNLTMIGSISRNTSSDGVSTSLPERSRYINQATTTALTEDFGQMLNTNGLIVIAESYVDLPFIFADIFSPTTREPFMELYNATAY